MTLLVTLYGLLIGSFLNVCIYRIPREESIAFPASHCPQCHYELSWYNNIPLLSYIRLLGRCSSCGDKISLQYPLVEALNVFLYILLYKHFGFGIDFIFYAIITSILIVITFIDLQEMIIPDVLIISILIASILYKFLNYKIYQLPMELLSSVLGLLLAGALFLFIVIVSKGGMGGGDVTLISALGFILASKKVLLNIFLSFIIGAIISLFLLTFKIKSRKDPIPFGPFINISFFIVLFYGEEIINWYLYKLL